jgi:hypothetical protein
MIPGKTGKERCVAVPATISTARLPVMIIPLQEKVIMLPFFASQTGELQPSVLTVILPMEWSRGQIMIYV